jgi:hypothetical protein
MDPSLPAVSPLRIFGKGGKTRYLPLHPATKGLLINNRIGVVGLPIWDSQAGSELIESRRD